MSRIVLLTLVCSAALAAAQYDSTSSPSTNERSKRQGRFDEDPFVGPDEGRENERERHHHEDNFPRQEEQFPSDSDSNDDDQDDFDDRRGPQFIPAPPFARPVANPFFAGPRPILVPNPSMIPIDPSFIPPAQPIEVPVSAQEGDGVIVEQVPSEPQFRADDRDFRRPSGQSDRFTTTTPTTTPSPPAPIRPSPGGFIPSSTLTCSSVRCPSGAVCRMENNGRSRREEPVCVFTGSNSPTSCNQVRCSTGFDCEMQQSSSCSRFPCPLNPVCVQTTPPPPIVSCDTVRCSVGTVCRIQIVDHCTSAPCAVQAVCASPCASVSCPFNSQCKVDERTLATSCVPNVPAQSPSLCSGVRCAFGQRCAVVQNCNWTRECKDEAKCI